jgi:hypothetical protein
LNGRITLQDFADNDNDEDSNASDDDFTLDEEYNDEVADEIALEEEDGSVGNNDPDLQEDYFQNPIQQHNNDVLNNNEPTTEIIPKSKRGINPIVTLSNTTVPKGYDKERKKKIDDENISINEDLDDPIVPNSYDAKVGGGDIDDNDESSTDTEDNDTVPKKLDSDLGPYWTLAQSTHAYMLSTITSYSNRYEATVKELDDNLLRMGAVDMLMPSKVSKKVRFEALNYLMFLKRKRCGKVKARGGADGRPQREYIYQKMNQALPPFQYMLS